MKTNKMKMVLIALDYDPTAQKVAEEGYALAKAMNAEVILLHVISDPINYSAPGHVTIMGFAGYLETSTLQIDSVDALKKASINFLDKSKQHLDDKTIQTIVGEGDLSESILKTAKSKHADVIVIGSHSRKWLENIVMGSVTEKVLRNTTIPLFIIPTKKRK
ncbi:MAG: universal stress protein [Bacteroidetes bacterium]|nr:universal stress protein [Bacteroidota bacterium]